MFPFPKQSTISKTPRRENSLASLFLFLRTICNFSGFPHIVMCKWEEFELFEAVKSKNWVSGGPIFWEGSFYIHFFGSRSSGIFIGLWGESPVLIWLGKSRLIFSPRKKERRNFFEGEMKAVKKSLNKLCNFRGEEKGWRNSEFCSRFWLLRHPGSLFIFFPRGT